MNSYTYTFETKMLRNSFLAIRLFLEIRFRVFCTKKSIVIFCIKTTRYNAETSLNRFGLTVK